MELCLSRANIFSSLNLEAIESLEKIGIYKPTQSQIDLMEEILTFGEDNE